MHPDPAELAELGIFESLAPEQLEHLAPWFEVRNDDAGTVLAGEGASGYSFFVLRAGTARVTRDGHELRTLRAGDFFGEVALLGDRRRTATVTAASPATVFALFGTEFRRLEQEHPDAAARISQAMEERLAADA